jgi:hypothetical protein
MFRIREATVADNDALLRLEADSPQGTGISILLDRDDYFYRSRLHDHCKVLIAEEGDRLVGIMAYAIKDILLDGVKDRAAYFFDLRGEASYRRSMKRGLFRLWKATLAEIEAAGAAFIYGHVKADNRDSMNICTKMGAKIAAPFDILSLPSLPGRPIALDNHLSTLETETARIESFVGDRSLLPTAFSAAYVRTWVTFAESSGSSAAAPSPRSVRGICRASIGSGCSVCRYLSARSARSSTRSLVFCPSRRFPLSESKSATCSYSIRSVEAQTASGY